MRVSKKYSIFLVLLLFPSFLFAGNNYYNYGGGVAGCTAVESNVYDTRTSGVIIAYDTTTDRWCAKSTFVAERTETVKNIQLQLKKNGSPTMTLTVSMCDSDGTSNCVEWDDIVDAATDVGTELTSWTSINDTTGKNLTATNSYTLLISANAINATNNVAWGYQAIGSTPVLSNNASGCSGTWVNTVANAVGNMKTNTCPQ